MIEWLILGVVAALVWHEEKNPPAHVTQVPGLPGTTMNTPPGGIVARPDLTIPPIRNDGSSPLPGFPFQVDPQAANLQDLISRCTAGDQEACSQLQAMGGGPPVF